jgi:hypothetical protein
MNDPQKKESFLSWKIGVRLVRRRRRGNWIRFQREPLFNGSIGQGGLHDVPRAGHGSFKEDLPNRLKKRLHCLLPNAVEIGIYETSYIYIYI